MYSNYRYVEHARQIGYIKCGAGRDMAASGAPTPAIIFYFYTTDLNLHPVQPQLVLFLVDMLM